MRQQISFLTQSRFYSPVFNAAIFDGPIRIYFAQYQEPVALKIYFATQEKMKDMFVKVRETFRRTGINIFVMLYPSIETFNMSFEHSNLNFIEAGGSPIIVERLGQDFVVGVKGPVSDEDVENIYARVEEIARSLTEMNPPPALQREVEGLGV
ncbi:MAG: hypothetical protein KDD38_08215 [Bdellovibrionales bacterium]|nr:hypothetical protein [Bdellovibrionales bacterium]